MRLDRETRYGLRLLVSDARRVRAELLLADEYRPSDRCDECSNEYTPSHPLQRFCSDRCRNRSNRPWKAAA